MTRTSGGIRTALAAALAGLALGACGGTAAEVGVETGTPATDAPATEIGEAQPTEAPTTAPEPSAEATPIPTEPASPEDATAGEDDGTWHTLVVEAEDDVITLDKVEILSGAEAAAAMAEDGQPVEEGAEMPYVRNRNPALRTLPVAADVTVEVLDCSAECTHTAWPYENLVDGTPLPYGPEDALFEVTVADGTIIKITEVYMA